MTKSKLSNDPLDSLISIDRNHVSKSSKTTEITPQQKHPLNGRSKKVRVTALLDESVADRVRDAVYWSPGQTLASFTEQAIIEAIQRAEKKRGEPFPKRNGEIHAGRPLK